MLILQGGVVSSWPEESHMSSNLNVNEFNDEKIHCSLNADSGSSRNNNKYDPFSEMLMWLRRVAIDPCKKKASSKTLQSGQVLKARKVLVLNSTELPWRKRKHHQLLKESSTAAADSPEKPNEQCLTGLSIGQRSFTSSVSCLISCADSAESSEHVLLNQPRLGGQMIHGDNLSRKRVLHGRSFQADVLDWSWSTAKEFPILLDSDNSSSGSYPPSPRKPVLQMLKSPVEILEFVDNLSVKQVDISSNHEADLTDRSSSPTNKKCPLVDSDDSVVSSNQLSPMKPKEHQTPRRSPRLKNFIGDYLPRLPIPIGPRFQVDVPDWTGSSTDGGSSYSNSDNSRWLGTRVWPVEGRKTEFSGDVIGKGRPCSCSCDFLDSIKCIKQHIVEKRLQLRAELGPSYFIWRFNEMGEEVSRSWTEKEQNSFDILVKTNPVSKNKSFLKPALKYFTCKRRASIVSYYFNVFVLRRLSRRTRLPSATADSDDDEADGSAGFSKSVKTRYLIRR